MMLTYSAGDQHLIAVPGAIALLPDTIPPAVTETIWRAMAGGDGFSAVLESLVGVYGASMGSLPPFAVVSWDAATGEGRVVVRGSAVARVVQIGGVVEQVSALGVTTWSERLIPGLEAVHLGVHLSDDRFGLRDGVVHAAGVSWEFASTITDLTVPSDASGSDAPLQRTPASEPEPEPEPEVEPAPASHVESEPEPEVESEPLADSAETRYPGIDEPVGHTYAAEPASLSDETTTYDDLIFGETRIGTVEEAAVRALDVAPEEAISAPPVPTPDSPISPVPGVPVPPVPPLPLPGLIGGVPLPPSAPSPAPVASASGDVPLGDHDGETISAAQLEAMQHLIAGAQVSSPEASAHGVAAVLLLPTGERVTLDRHAVVGRRPRAVRATGTVPHLVTVVSPHQDVSRSHVELRVEGSSVVAIDLGTTNGTRLLRVGADPVRLQPGDPALLVEGDQLDISDGVVLSFEGL